ncbi:MAG: hypothetical protein WBM75_14400 [Polyangiales bacterium]|jgi:hypothetical protein
MELAYRALDEAGNALAAKALQEKIEIMLELLGLMLKTYCEKGRMISTLELQRAVSAERVHSPSCPSSEAAEKI